jgi:hypothetical protein
MNRNQEGNILDQVPFSALFAVTISLIKALLFTSNTMAEGLIVVLP